jgi:Alkylmercury lyase
MTSGGRVTAAAGLSVEPTRHRLQTSGGARWTNCAYDALGILGALGVDGEIATTSPLTAKPITVGFEAGRPAGSDVVLFLADQSGLEGLRVIDEVVCPEAANIIKTPIRAPKANAFAE